MGVITNKEIADYYDTHTIIYRLFWSKSALHYGFWYDDTKNLAEAISNTDKFVIDVLSIDDKDDVLDAGCGIGGSSTYIAKRFGVKVTGITLSNKQLKTARKRARTSGTTHLTHFSKQDFTNTDFDDNTFSKVFGIESVCYAYDKLAFLTEAYRIMRPGGKIAVVDAFLTRENLDLEETDIYNKVLEGWRLPDLPSEDTFAGYMKQAGFCNVRFHNMQKYVQRSSKQMYNRNLVFYPINIFASYMGFVRRNLSSVYQKALLDKNIAAYGVFVAEKPI